MACLKFLFKIDNIIDFSEFTEVPRTYCSPKDYLGKNDMNLADVKRKCLDDITCDAFYKSGSNKKYYKCRNAPEVKTSNMGSVLYLSPQMCK